MLPTIWKVVLICFRKRVRWREAGSERLDWLLARMNLRLVGLAKLLAQLDRLSYKLEKLSPH
jgi:hypothetical protein